jgi:hypothetical protein
MSTPQIISHDVATGETFTRDMTANEIAQSQADKVTADKEAEDLAKSQADKAATRSAVLTRLGLTSDELLALLS